MDSENIAEINVTSASSARLSAAEWQAHLIAAQQFKGSDAEYCRRNGLNPSRFKANKNKFGMMRRYKPRTEAFIKVEPTPSDAQPMTTSSARFERTHLPDPKWVAELITALIITGR